MIKNFLEFVNETHIDWLTGLEVEDEVKAKGQEPDLADFTVEQFYQTLQDFVESGRSMPVQAKGQMTYSKMVENIQAALSFLGYPLQRFGVDGLFGPETATAIRKFNDDTAPMMAERIKSFVQFVNEAENGMLDQSELIQISDPGKTGGAHKLNPEAAKAYEEMRAAAEADGINWSVTDSYRDYETQVQTAAKKGLYSQGGLAATPGRSNHGWGSALDLKLDSAAQEWLRNNAAKYGFSSIPKEPWHWEHKASADSAKGLRGTTEVGSVMIDSDLVSRIITALKAKNFSQNDINKFVKTPIANVATTEDDDFYSAIITSLGGKVTDEKMKFLKAWRQGEGGTAKNNPFNTTKDVPGDQDTKYNSAGVRNYPDRQTGLEATIATLKLPYYRDIVSLLQSDDATAADLAKAVEASPWGTGHNVAKVLGAGSVNPPAIA
jgi:peptidoglycan hydrolase-like protein with peptidoglycan-binding domain